MRFVLAFALVCGCGVPAEEEQQAPPPPPPMEQPQPEVKQPELTGLPCDVQSVLENNCAGCHAKAVYFTSFKTRSDLVLLGSKVSDRLTSSDRPMPPYAAPRVPTTEERQLLVRWVQDGMPAGACGGLQ